MISLTGILKLEQKLNSYDPVTRLIRSEHERAFRSPLRQESWGVLAGHPVHNGEILEVYHEGEWVVGRYECDPIVSPEPILQIGDRILCIDQGTLLRWTQNQ